MSAVNHLWTLPFLPQFFTVVIHALECGSSSEGSRDRSIRSFVDDNFLSIIVVSRVREKMHSFRVLLSSHHVCIFFFLTSF